ncbi:methyltransferase [Herbihabitans rhizosphaerae]|nr:methyltransferase [Herbihabitans rhizosphaerae]
MVDIGGGSGPLIAAVLAANPHLRGTVLDQADGVRYTPKCWPTPG